MLTCRYYSIKWIEPKKSPMSMSDYGTLKHNQSSY